jgi:hypothetical protein
MNDELSEPMRTEMFAASLRADSTDIRAFLEALAVKLEGSLPGNTIVTRHNSLFSRERPVKEVVVSLGEYQYGIGRERQGPLVARRAKVVRGIVLKTEQIPVDQWIEELSEALAQMAGQSAQTRAALERFLLQ